MLQKRMTKISGSGNHNKNRPTFLISNPQMVDSRRAVHGRGHYLGVQGSTWLVKRLVVDHC